MNMRYDFKKAIGNAVPGIVPALIVWLVARGYLKAHDAEFASVMLPILIGAFGAEAASFHRRKREADPKAERNVRKTRLR
jgi:hypothetical protein